MLKRIAPIAIATALLLPLAMTAEATSPGKNGVVAFHAQTDAGSQIFTMLSSGQQLRQITNIVGNAAGSEWSPDGSRLLFGVDEFEATESPCVIAFAAPDGGHLTRLATDPFDLTPGVTVCHGDGAWFPDGEHIVLGRFDPARDEETVWSVRVDGTDWVQLETGSPIDPNISPDGSRISFKGDGGALFVQDLGGGDAVRVSPEIDVAFKHDWAPDGSQLVFSDYANPDETQPVNIATVSPDGTDFTFITHFTDPRFRAYVGSYSPDGRWIVFRLEDGSLNALYRIRPDGTAMHRITAWSQFRPRSIDWGAADR